MSKLVENTFKNKLGQTLEVGDKVAFVASGRGNCVTVGSGVYVGTVNDQPSVSHDKTSWGYWDKDGKRLDWGVAHKLNIARRRKTYLGRTTLRLGRVFKLA